MFQQATFWRKFGEVYDFSLITGGVSQEQARLIHVMQHSMVLSGELQFVAV
jgi:hypothetical protein